MMLNGADTTCIIGYGMHLRNVDERLWILDHGATDEFGMFSLDLNALSTAADDQPTKRKIFQSHFVRFVSATAILGTINI